MIGKCSSYGNGNDFILGTRAVQAATSGELYDEIDMVDPYIGVGGVQVPAADAAFNADFTAPNGAATIQATIDALVALDIQVVTLGADTSFFNPAPNDPTDNPRRQLEAISILTGALNGSVNPINSGDPLDPIDPGEALYFPIDTQDPLLGQTITNAIVQAVVGSVDPPDPPPDAPPPPPPAAGGDDDTLVGGEGNDTILSGDGNDIITGNEGNDSIVAGNGNDTVDGGEGSDTINGGNGEDIVDGGLGDDTVNGGNDNDSYVWDGDGDGDDFFINDGGGDVARIFGDAADETFNVQEGGSRL